ncbi:MAG: FAD-binding oxidoreductase [Actinomycetota bacterium]|nr:FAD-binding oxidoreductase [Actinomycetota bacterium]
MISWKSPESLWLSQIEKVQPRKTADRDMHFDVAIAGGGYSGLWTAFYLKTVDPSLKIAIFDAKYAGFGASGRNGGWASTLFASSLTSMAERFSKSSAINLYCELHNSLTEIEKVIRANDIDADFHKGGTITVARNSSQLKRAEDTVNEYRNFGFDTYSLLEQSKVIERINVPSAIGGTYTTECARIQPAKLVRGLANLVEEIGVEIYEKSLVSELSKNYLKVNGNKVAADVVVEATEGYRCRIKSSRRRTIPIYSLMIATRRLSKAEIETVGLRDYETFADERNLIIYGQRSNDDRIVFGGRGAPYHFGSEILPKFDSEESIFNLLEETLYDLIPSLRGVEIEYKWGGALAVPRDFLSFVEYDGKSYARLGGYVGDGVTTSNLAARTLADLILGRSSSLTSLPIVNPQRRNWEIEPLRSIGINLGIAGTMRKDKLENQGQDGDLVTKFTDSLMNY